MKCLFGNFIIMQIIYISILEAFYKKAFLSLKFKYILYKLLPLKMILIINKKPIAR